MIAPNTAKKPPTVLIIPVDPADFEGYMAAFNYITQRGYLTLSITDARYKRHIGRNFAKVHQADAVLLCGEGRLVDRFVTDVIMMACTQAKPVEVFERVLDQGYHRPEADYFRGLDKARLWDARLAAALDLAAAIARGDVDATTLKPAPGPGAK